MTHNLTKAPQPYCSEVCLTADEPLAGTAIRVDVWLMLEYRRAWQAKALDHNTLSDATNLWLADTVKRFASAGLIARPQFIRRPERTEGMRLFVARDGQLGGTTVASEAELVTLDLVATALPNIVEPQYFVCTNAKRDICCAKFGRPTYTALHNAVAGRAWQTTHVGGHRYAPNILTLPQAALYGRVMDTDVPAFLQATEQQKLARQFLRGKTGHSKVAQVGDQVVAQHTGAEDHRLLSETSAGATFATGDAVFEVAVEAASEAVEVLPSCGKAAEIVQPLVGRLVSSKQGSDLKSDS